MSKRMYYNVGEINQDSKEIEWYKKEKGTFYDDGICPRCCLNEKGYVGETHISSHDNSDYLYYNTGTLDRKIKWNITQDDSDDAKGTRYAEGSKPCIANNSENYFIIVFQSPWSTLGRDERNGILYFNTGLLDLNENPPKINLNSSSEKFQHSSSKPNLAMNNNGYVIVVSESIRWNKKGVLKVDGVTYREGVFENGKLQFWGSNPYPIIINNKFSNPSVAVNDLGDIVALFSKPGSDDLYCILGTVNKGGVEWKEESLSKYAKGSLPTVAINNNREVVAIHNSGKELIYLIGKVGENSIDWFNKPGESFDTGEGPSVAINNNGKVLVVHDS